MPYQLPPATNPRRQFEFEIKQLADRGLVEIVAEHTVQRADEQLIDHLSFKRLR